jgi:hypothetical protein
MPEFKFPEGVIITGRVYTGSHFISCISAKLLAYDSGEEYITTFGDLIKALSAIKLTLSGIFIFIRELHLLNVESPINSTPSNIRTLVNKLQD